MLSCSVFSRVCLCIEFLCVKGRPPLWRGGAVSSQRVLRNRHYSGTTIPSYYFFELNGCCLHCPSKTFPINVVNLPTILQAFKDKLAEVCSILSSNVTVQLTWKLNGRISKRKFRKLRNVIWRWSSLLSKTQVITELIGQRLTSKT